MGLNRENIHLGNLYCFQIMEHIPAVNKRQNFTFQKYRVKNIMYKI